MAAFGIDAFFRISVHAGIVKWPMSVIRLQGREINELVDAANHIRKVERLFGSGGIYI